jgi:dUTP pyrophosphatase
MDLMAAVTDPVRIEPNQRALIPTGLTIALPSGYELQIRPRSGLALRHGITLPNSPGTIDEDYRGEIQIIVLNSGAETFVVERGTRIAQAVLAPVSRASWVEVDSLDRTARDTGGFGSTGGFATPGE